MPRADTLELLLLLLLLLLSLECPTLHSATACRRADCCGYWLSHYSLNPQWIVICDRV